MARRDIAIIGMSCRVAGANSPSELWDLLASSKNVQSEITRFNARGFYHPQGGPLKGLTNVKNAYMLDDSLIDRFDNTFFRISPQEAACIDPQQRILLEIAYEAVENAGILLDDLIGSNTGVYAGPKPKSDCETFTDILFRHGRFGLPHHCRSKPGPATQISCDRHYWELRSKSNLLLFRSHWPKPSYR